MVLFGTNKNLTIYPFHLKNLPYKPKTSRFPCFTTINISLTKNIIYPSALCYPFIILYYAVSTTTAQRQKFILSSNKNIRYGRKHYLTLLTLLIMLNTNVKSSGDP